MCQIFTQNENLLCDASVIIITALLTQQRYNLNFNNIKFVTAEPQVLENSLIEIYIWTLLRFGNTLP